MDRLSTSFGWRFLAVIIPVLMGVFGVLLANFPVSVLGGLVAPPLLVLMPVYYWGMVRPDLMTPFWAFVLGVLEDLFSGGPPGIWAAALLVGYIVVDRERDVLAGLSGIGAILGFSAVALAVCSTAYVIAGIYFWHIMPLAAAMAEFAMTVTIYVFAAMLFGSIHHRLVGPLRSDF